ncbi:MAG: UDP-N-acetylmuramoyl-L-alanyl-D-glutamate--2,6-diaminopimelate ligase [Acidimicrobiia bacterium]|nr:UDP-N-acetylmuramoyl-L-alanyl-D-glutamate--2,6-diaminopimelate ligase [Acidimicrobiia bacterium]
MPGVDLASLATTIGGSVVGDGSVRVADVVHDSRMANPTALFVAIRGFQADGHDFVASAVARGAAAVCVEQPGEPGVPQLVVANTRLALGPLAAEVWGHPSRAIPVVGLTGTNGKTTVTHMLEAIFTADHRRTGVIGTIGARLSGGSGDTRRLRLERTTPESSDLQRLFAEMVEDEAGVIAMEVSSHALSLGRVDGTRFAVAAFTNLSLDHLDFHPDMDAYFEAKATLFDRAPNAVVCIDGPYGRRLADRISRRTDVKLITVGAGGDVSGTITGMTADGADVVVSSDGADLDIHLPLPGEFNVANALVAIGCARALGVPDAATVRGLAAIAPISGRFERIDHDGQFSVFVDYAHTPDGVEVVIAAARRFATGRVIVVIGAGGDRDTGKRPMMGQAASAADLVILTSDNPRSEDPDVIISHVRRGVSAGVDLIIEPDRRAAIGAALGEAGPGDVVLILGKGHEQGQEIGTQVLPFDDRSVAVQVLSGVGA